MLNLNSLVKTCLTTLVIKSFSLPKKYDFLKVLQQVLLYCCFLLKSGISWFSCKKLTNVGGVLFFFFFTLTCFVLQIVLLKKSSGNLGAVLILFVCCVYYVRACMCVACVWRLEDNTHKLVLCMWVRMLEFRSAGLATGALTHRAVSLSEYIVLGFHRPILIRKRACWHSAQSENRVLPCSQCWMIKRFPFFKKATNLKLDMFF